MFVVLMTFQAFLMDLFGLLLGTDSSLDFGLSIFFYLFLVGGYFVLDSSHGGYIHLFYNVYRTTLGTQFCSLCF